MTLRRRRRHAVPSLLAPLALFALLVPPAAAGADSPEAEEGWAIRLGGRNRDYVTAVAAAPDGGAWVAGRFRGELPLGGAAGTLAGAGNSDGFLVRLGPVGEIVGGWRLAGPGADEVRGLAAAPEGGVWAAGFFSGRAELGTGGPTLESVGSADAFLARFAADGRILWARRLGGELGDVAFAVAATPDGGAVVTGYLQGEVRSELADRPPGEAPEPGAGETPGSADGERPAAAAPRRIDSTGAGGADLFAARYDAGGDLLWLTRLAGSRDDEGRAVAVGADGAVALAGRFAGSLDAGAAGRLESAGRSDGLLLLLAPDGTPRRLERLGGPEADALEAVAFAGDSVIVAGRFPPPGEEAAAATLAAIGEAGELLWNAPLARGPGSFPTALAADPAGSGTWTAGFSLPAVAEGGRAGAGRTTAFLERHDASGRRVAARELEGEAGLQVLALVPGAGGRPLLAGVFEGRAALPEAGTSSLASAGKVDSFVLSAATP